MKRIRILMMVLVVITVLMVTSCAVLEDEFGGKHIRMTPQAHKAVEDVGKGATDILGILSMFFPALAPAAAATAAGTITWKRMGNKITKYKTPLEHTVTVLEELKKDEELWAKVKPYLKGGSITQSTDGGTRTTVLQEPSAVTEATIREVIDAKKGAI
jgi:hypothetical protein